MDLLERAFYESKAVHWDDLSDWFKQNAQSVSGAQRMIQASDSAAMDGRIFPDSAEELRDVLLKYARQDQPYYGHSTTLSMHE